jgi:NAD(P)-dependent dehydrogenase (short-subunit alcohol dehydrogenase family)
MSVMRRVIVIGGTSGIGRAIGERFAADGAQVIATGASTAETSAAEASAAQTSAAQTSANHANISFEVLDVRDAAAVDALMARQASLDVLVNCAGIIRRGEEHDHTVFAQVIDINLNGTMRTCSAARPLLAKSRGCIINTASMLTFFGGGLVPGYSASKGGIGQLTKSLAIAYAVDGIRVNAVAPGWIATPLTEALQNDPARSDPIVARTPLKRWGTPQDVADPVAFLASDAARFITGVILPVDGGYLIA